MIFRKTISMVLFVSVIMASITFIGQNKISADMVYHTIWQADPSYISGKNVGDDVSEKFNWGSGSSKNPVYYQKDNSGIYYALDISQTGFNILESGISSSSAGFGWLNDLDTLKALSPYMQLFFSYRITADNPSSIAEGKIRFYPSGLNVAHNGDDTLLYTLTLSDEMINSGWKTLTVKNQASKWGTATWKNGYFAIKCSNVAGYHLDIRDIKIQLKEDNAELIKNALKECSYSYNDLISCFGGTVPEDDEDTNVDTDIEYDINMDGNIGILDLVRFKRMLNNQIPHTEKYDINRDGKRDAFEFNRNKKSFVVRCIV